VVDRGPGRRSWLRRQPPRLPRRQARAPNGWKPGPSFVPWWFCSCRCLRGSPRSNKAPARRNATARMGNAGLLEVIPFSFSTIVMPRLSWMPAPVRMIIRFRKSLAAISPSQGGAGEAEVQVGWFVRGDRPPASATCPWESGEGRSAISLTALRNGLPPFVSRCGSLLGGEARYTVPSTEKGRALPMPEPTKRS